MTDDLHVYGAAIDGNTEDYPLDRGTVARFALEEPDLADWALHGVEDEYVLDADGNPTARYFKAAPGLARPLVRAVTNLVNLTPHSVTLVGDGGTVVIQPTGAPARVTLSSDQPDLTVRVCIGEDYRIGVPVVVTATTGEVTGLPPAAAGTLYIVSRPVAAARPERDDLVVPHDTVRDDCGVVIGCRALAKPAS
jgi:hypothetical protein